MNHQSRRAIERLGAKLDGILRSHQIAANGTLRDTCVYSIIAPEWPTVRAHLKWLLEKPAKAKLTGHAERPAQPAQSAKSAHPHKTALPRGRMPERRPQNPDVNIRGLLADDRRDNSGDAAQFHPEPVVRRLLTNAPDGQRIFAIRRKYQMNEPRLRASAPPSPAESAALRDQWFISKTMEVHCSHRAEDRGALRRLPVLIAIRDLPGRDTQHIQRLRKRRPALDVMVADQLKYLAL